jgi:membrane protease YdiL (CAAX protease family)
MKQIQTQSKKHALLWAGASYIGFFLLWSLWVVLKHTFSIGDWIEGIFSMSDVIWLACGISLIALNRKMLYIKPGEMLKTLPSLRILFPLLAVIALYYGIAMFTEHGGFYIHSDKSVAWLLVMFLIVAIQEELLFRGWFFNVLCRAVTERKANLISALFFLFIHFPGWIRAGHDVLTIVWTGAGIFVLGLVFGWSFRKSRSIWTPIILHMIWDTLSRLVF